jgi:hypothetical protein
MKKGMMIIAAIVILTACKEKERKVTTDMLNFPQSASGEMDMDLPKIEFDSTTYHFGEIAIGSKVKHTFKFSNTGSAPLVITDVKPSCGCTSLKDWPKEPIQPGENGQISVEFNSDGFPGDISKSIMVHTNAVPKDVFLKLEGKVVGIDNSKEVKPSIQMERTR